MGLLKYGQLPIENDFGFAYVEYNKSDDKYYLITIGYNKDTKVEISKSFFKACIKEFEIYY